MIIIVSKLFDCSNAYDNEWAVPEFNDETGNCESSRREWSEGVPDGTELFSTLIGRYRPDSMVSAD